MSGPTLISTSRSSKRRPEAARHANLGVDPGSESTGYGLIESDGSEHRVVAYGAIKTPPRRLLQPPAKYLQRPDRTARPGTGRCNCGRRGVLCANVQSALKSVARELFCSWRRSGGCALQYSPLEVKRGIVGYGRAEKAQVQAWSGSVLHMHNPDTARCCRRAGRGCMPCASHENGRRAPGETDPLARAGCRQSQDQLITIPA
jgi:crossover junction endodeoxyribonuclease RuvC